MFHLPLLGQHNARRKRKYSSNVVLALPALGRRGSESNVPQAASSYTHPFSTSQNEMKITKDQERSTISKRGRKRKYELPTSSAAPFVAISPLKSTMNNFAYFLEVKTGEDISSKIYSFCKGRCMCVLSANGSVSQALLSRATGDIVSYEGQFDLVRLSGIPSKDDGLSVMLAGQGNKVFGGRVVGTIFAASSTQVILGSLTKLDC